MYWLSVIVMKVFIINIYRITLMRYLTVSILFIFLAIFPSVSQNSPEYLNLVEQADSAIAVGHWDVAESNLLDAINLEPDNPGNILLMSNLGIVRFNQGNDSLALASLHEAHRQAPSSVTVLSNLARVNAALGNIEEAYKNFETIMELDSMLWEPLFYHGMIAMNIGDINQAATDFSRLEILAPDEPDTHLALASFYTAIDEKQRALSEFNWLIDREPTVETLLERAIINIQLEYLNEASSDLAYAIALDPDWGELYLYRAILNKLRFRIDDAKTDALKAIELGVDKERVKRVGVL